MFRARIFRARILHARNPAISTKSGEKITDFLSRFFNEKIFLHKVIMRKTWNFSKIKKIENAKISIAYSKKKF